MEVSIFYLVNYLVTGLSHMPCFPRISQIIAEPFLMILCENQRDQREINFYCAYHLLVTNLINNLIKLDYPDSCSRTAI